MASNQLGLRTKAHINQTISGLFGRALTFQPCPLDTDTKRVAFWESYLDPEVLKCRRYLIDGGYEEAFGRVSNTRQGFRWEGYSVALWSPDTSMLNLPRRDLLADYNDSTIDIRTGCAAAEIDVQDFMHWIRTCVGLNEELNEATETLKNVVDFAKTPGQLRRMVPDLVQYLDRDTQDILSEQVRNSKVCFEWAAFDKDRVQRLLLAMAKCYLLPKSERKWRHTHGLCWAS